MSQQPCLPVPRRRKRQDEDEKVDFNNMDIESMDANEYLSAVVQEASALPVVFVADGISKAKPAEQHYKDHVPIDGSAASLSYLTSKQTAVVPPPTAQHAPPNQKWVDMTLTNFSELRSYLDRCHEQGVGGKGTKRMSVPSLRDRSGWHVFCVGLDEARGNTGCYFDEDEQSDNEKNEDEFPEWRNNLPQEGYIPSFNCYFKWIKLWCEESYPIWSITCKMVGRPDQSNDLRGFMHCWVDWTAPYIVTMLPHCTDC
jgi:hypothetical protein